MYLPVIEGLVLWFKEPREGESACDNLEGRESGLDVASCTARVYFRHPNRSGLLSTITLSISKGD